MIRLLTRVVLIKIIIVNSSLEPIYDLKIATSNDGLNWECSGKTAIKLMPGWGGISKASILKIGDFFHMWFSYRKKLIIEIMKKNLSNTLQIDESFIGIKAATNEKLGPEGREEGISCHSVVLLEKK